MNMYLFELISEYILKNDLARDLEAILMAFCLGGGGNK